LWQSEDLEAVIDQDVGRTCILQGPTAVKYSKVVDEPIKEILDGIHTAHIKGLIQDIYGGEESTIPVTEYFGGVLIDTEPEVDVEGLTISQDTHKTTYRLSSSPTATLPSLESWLSLLAGGKRSWRHARAKISDQPNEADFRSRPRSLRRDSSS
jgi:fatty acid synthase subunit beta